MADMTLNPIALLKTVVVIVAGVAIGYLVADKDRSQAVANKAAAAEKMEQRLGIQPREQSEGEQPRISRFDPDYIQQRVEENRAAREARQETRTFGERLADKVPTAPAEPDQATEASETPAPAQPERKTVTWGSLGADRQQQEREQRNTGTEQTSD
ncbi:hypothetical protein [Vibrio japonicus]|uniref:Cell division protein ZipA n=1 Tax=Vibrio japonicus TaxID=1824638 RepID=A0ABY5LR70_9VIBR|nr:hypothetical protein [Vibrio japonicus]UUM33199.1 hypothetical protein NP165_19935 [Vibrio japonicus]